MSKLTAWKRNELLQRGRSCRGGLVMITLRFPPCERCHCSVGAARCARNIPTSCTVESHDSVGFGYPTSSSTPLFHHNTSRIGEVWGFEELAKSRCFWETIATPLCRCSIAASEFLSMEISNFFAPLSPKQHTIVSEMR